jgi:hypothetical protein
MVRENRLRANKSVPAAAESVPPNPPNPPKAEAPLLSEPPLPKLPKAGAFALSAPPASFAKEKGGVDDEEGKAKGFTAEGAVAVSVEKWNSDSPLLGVAPKLKLGSPKPPVDLDSVTPPDGPRFHEIPPPPPAPLLTSLAPPPAPPPPPPPRRRALTILKTCTLQVNMTLSAQPTDDP